MSNVLDGKVVNCSTCTEATTVFTINGTWFECAAIRNMGIERKPKYHPAHQVMVVYGEIFVPKCCPIPEIEKIGQCYE